MEIDISIEDLRSWRNRLEYQFKTLGERFGPAVLDNSQYKSLCIQGNNGEVHLRKIATGKDVLATVQCLMALALGDCGTSASDPIQTLTSLEQLHIAHPVYETVPLHGPDKQIRLVELLPGSEDEPIELNLIVVNWLESRRYEALSYVWGFQGAEVTVWVNKSPFEISINLADALRCLRRVDQARVMWIDAMCINQTDVIEKSHQVALMGKIYRQADEVLIFLGEEKDNSAMVMQYLNLGDVEGLVDFRSVDEIDEATKLGGTYPKRKLVDQRVQYCGFDVQRFCCAIDAFFKRPWWSRVWVIQESELAKHDPRFYCGKIWTPSKNIKARSILLVEYLVELAMWDPEVSKNLQIDIDREWTNIFERRWNFTQLFQRQTRGTARSDASTRFSMTRNLRRHSTDPRDRIFATREMMSSLERDLFAPNHAIDINRLFSQATCFVLCYENDHGHIYDLYQLNRSPNVPTWSIGLSTPLPHQGVVALNQYWKYDVNDQPAQRASWAKGASNPTVLGKILSLRGTQIDTIDVAERLKYKNDIDFLGAFWKLEAILQKTCQKHVFPGEVRVLFPEPCFIPFPERGNGGVPQTPELTSRSGQLLTTFSIPGYAYVVSQCVKLGLHQISQTLKHLKCDVLTPPAKLYVYTLLTNLSLVAARSSSTESFIGGSYFDTKNLKAQIMSTELLRPGETTSNNVAKRAVELSPPVCSTSSYVPKYAYLKDILQQAKQQSLLDELKKVACKLVDACRQAIDEHLANKGPPSSQVREELRKTTEEAFATNESFLRGVAESCTCADEKRTWHQKVIRDMSEYFQGAANTLKPIVLSFNPEQGDRFYGLSTNFKKQYTGMCISRRGLCGFVFQSDPAIRTGQKLVVLDGIPAPMILEDTGDGKTHRMIAAVEVLGLRAGPSCC